MLLFAVTALEAMKELPPNTWIKIGVVIAAIIVLAVVVPRIFKMNKIILGVIVFVTATIVLSTWVSQRNEPKFLTPLIDRLAPFFSSDVVRTTKDKKLPK
jgi:Mn2+/Fe2+ NRAMP family transporter